MTERRSLHPNIARYPFRDFMRDVQEWRKFQDLSAVCPEPEISERLVRIPDNQTRSHGANAARISHMLSLQGHTGENRIFRGQRFQAVLTQVAHALPQIRREFIALSDGVVTDVSAEILAAFHEFFLNDPMPSECDVTRCIDRAKEFGRTGIWDAPII